jgi:flagellar biosynthesis protein FlhF
MRLRLRTSRHEPRLPEPVTERGRNTVGRSDTEPGEELAPDENAEAAGGRSTESGMHLKSFFAATVEAALAAGSRELGPEAMIVQSRRSPSEWRHLGEYEVVLAVTAPPAARVSRPAAADPAPAPGDPLARELAELRRQLDGMRRSLSRSAVSAPRWLAPSSQAAEIFSVLVAAEVELELAQQVAEAVAARLGPLPVDQEIARRAARVEIESRFSVDASLGRPGADCRVVALAGPPGSGKTTTLVKLAAHWGLKARRPVMLISADYHRIGAADQLRTFAAILGMAYESVESPAALAQVLQQHAGKELILIDTPGLAAAEMDQGHDLARFLAARPECDTHLVLSASMKSADITRAVDRFAIFQPAKLLFTRLDETDSWGPILSEAARTHKPISFLATGQQIPEHLEPATQSRLTEQLLPAAEARAAA